MSPFVFSLSFFLLLCSLPFFPLSPQADLCVPRLNEGDQVVLINGRDISDHTHDQVVMFIKASCESHSGELILLVRPNGELFPLVESTASTPTLTNTRDGQKNWKNVQCDSMLQSCVTEGYIFCFCCWTVSDGKIFLLFCPPPL